MIKEDYVSFETAKLLKEKGFDADTDHDMWYVVEKFSTGCHWNSCTYKVGDITREYDEKYCIVMPTLQMVMKWLREIHKIHITVYPYGEHSCDNYQFDIYKNREYLLSKDEGYITNEQAIEVAIKYCLENLI